MSLAPVFQLTRRDHGLDDDLQVGEYRPRPAGAVSRIALRCLNCKGLGQLLRTSHSVDDVSGEVSPVVACPYCEFVCFLVLADWVPEARGSA